MSHGRARVVSTGAPGALPGLREAVEVEGAEFSEWPLLAFIPPADIAPLVNALRGLHQYAAVCVTSPRAAEAVVRLLRDQGIDLASASPVCWTSPACEALLRTCFGRVEVPPVDRRTGSLGVALARTMLEHHVGSPVLFPCGDLHRDELVAALRDAGRMVHPVEAYGTVLAASSRAGAALAAADIVLVTSPSVAKLLAAAEHRERPALVAIGPTTADAARQHGWPPDAVAASPVVSAVAAAIHSLLPSYS